MELISKDSLWKEVTTRIEEYADIADIIEIIEHQPIIEERKTGTWEKQRGSDSSWNCSVCKEIVVAMPEQMGRPLYDYCPYCSSYNGGITDERYTKLS